MLQNTSPRFAGQNGQFEISLGWRHAWQTIRLHGGPFAKFPKFDPAAWGICLREDRPTNCDFWLPIHDFSVPEDDEQVVMAVKEIITAALSGKDVYAGCMGGWGRTGLFLAIVAKALGVEKPVEFIREHYTSRAVETKEQYQYVMNFDVSAIRAWLPYATWSAWMRGWFPWLRG